MAYRTDRPAAKAEAVSIREYRVPMPTLPLPFEPIAAANPRLGSPVPALEQRQRDEALLRFAAAMDATADAIYLVDRTSMSFVYVNDAACRLHNLARQDLIALEPWRPLVSSRAELEQIYDEMIEGGVYHPPLEVTRRRTDGSVLWIEVRRSAQFIGDRWTIVTLVRDITERKEAEAKIIRLNRVYAMLSGTNSLIVRARDKIELFKEACRIAVDHGHFKMAWIGLVDEHAPIIVPVASAGMPEEFIGLIENRFLLRKGAHSLGTGSAARAISDKKAVVFNEIIGDITVLLAAERLEHGIGSMAILPLLVSGEAVGVFALYSAEDDFFDAEEIQLLQDLADDIAFAIDYIAKAEKLSFLAYYDPITGLANRTLFNQRLEENVLDAQRQDRRLFLILLDIERFKTINDSLGWNAGDALLKELASRLLAAAGSVGGDRMARIDADHFAVYVSDLQTKEDLARRIAARLVEVLAPPLLIGGSVLRIAAKLGIAMYPDDGADAGTLFKNAESALKIAKASGERYVFYTRSMTERVAGNLALEIELRRAIDEEEFVLYYQPKVHLVTGKITGAEALIRWNHPTRGLVAPAMFIPTLEETGLILQVGRWALRRAVDDSLRWRAAGRGALRVAVNVSPLQLRHRAFVDEIKEVVGGDAHAAASLELEITESVIMANVTQTSASLETIRALGVTIAIDDFGTGFSSLNYLAKLAVDTLKIDRSFVLDTTTGPTGLALVSAIISLAHALNLKTVAEGVETEEQRQLLQNLKCDEMQGFLFGAAVPREAFEKLYLGPARLT